jgi:hypothetical protein
MRNRARILLPQAASSPGLGVQADLEADRQVATTLAELIIGRMFASNETTPAQASGRGDDAA